MSSRKFSLKLKRHGFFHRHNPFNKMLRNRLTNTLGASASFKTLFTSPVLDQGTENDCSEVGSYAIRAATTGKTYKQGAYVQAEQGFTNDLSTTEFDVRTVMETAVLSGFEAADGTTDQPSAVLWIYPNNGMDLYDSIQSDINQYQRPVGVGITWCTEWEAVGNGIVPFSANSVLGGHWTMICGKVTEAINSKVLFPELDRMANQNSWGIQAPGSDSGFYYFSRQEVNAWFGNLGVGLWIDSDDNVTRILGRISAIYTKILELLHLP